MPLQKVVVFVHGWSVHNTNTYGVLPARIESEALNNAGLQLDVRHIWLSKYVSFRDEVRLDDISRAFEAALRKELGDVLATGQKVVCITHSTGGPVVRNWIDKYYVAPGQIGTCPVSHLIMLAPANFGSALAQLGKSRISRIKSWFEGVEPGQGVLDWLELGSPESWDLNSRWIGYSSRLIDEGPVFCFVITGQSIERKFYDHVNSYTGELGSDGVVRMAAANLNMTLLEYTQDSRLDNFIISPVNRSAQTAFCIAQGCSHCRKDKGIMESVKNDGQSHATVTAIVSCLKVSSAAEYAVLCDDFAKANDQVRAKEQVEKEDIFLLPDRYLIHDPNAMVIFRVQDDKGQPIERFDLILTAGPQNSPNHLPEGFLIDRQRNSRHIGTITYFFNHALMRGSTPVFNPFTNKNIRDALAGTSALGLSVEPHITKGFVHFTPCSSRATENQLHDLIQKDQTTLVNIVMKRVVHEGVFRLTQDRKEDDFKDADPGSIIA